MNYVGPRVPRVLINNECVGPFVASYNNFKHNYRDVICLGDCDSIVKKLIGLLKWELPSTEDVCVLYKPPKKRKRMKRMKRIRYIHKLIYRKRKRIQ